MKKIRILQIIKGLDIGGDSGGAELFGVKLAQELNKNNQCEVMICAFYSVGTSTEKEWENILINQGIDTFFVSEWGGNNNLIKFLKGIKNLLKQYNEIGLDVTHSHFQLGTVASIILKIFGVTKKAFRTSHIRREWNEGKWTWFLNPVFIRWIFPKYLDGEIGVSNAVVEYLKSRKVRNLDENKIHLIYNGINIQKIIDESKQIDLLPIPESNTKPFIIGCVGRLTEQKGYPYIIQSMKIISARFPSVRLLIVGDGELRDELTRLVRDLELCDYIFFLGLRKNVPMILKQCDVFVLPSLWEGLPTVVMEAMICSIPVIATDIPGTRELIENGKTGFLVKPCDVAGLANMIIEILNNEKLRGMVTSNAIKEVQVYDMKEISKDYIKLYL